MDLNNISTVRVDNNKPENQTFNTTASLLMSDEPENQTAIMESYQVTKSSSFITYSVINTIFCILGIVGNILILMVYWKKKDKSGARTFTMALGVIDLLACLGAMSLEPLNIANIMPYLAQDLLSKYLIFLVFSSIFVLLAISVDRFYAVYKPIEFNINSEKRAKLSFLLILPADIFFVTAYQMGIDGLAYFGISCITIGGCFSAMTVLYGAIFVKLYKRNRVTVMVRDVSTGPPTQPTVTTNSTQPNDVIIRQEGAVNSNTISGSVSGIGGQQNSHSKFQQRQLLGTARMFAVVTVVFVLSYVPALLASQRILPASWYLENTYYLNHITNPVIYGALSKTFRKDMKKLFNKRG